jgi:hypothetical protein
MPFLLMVAVTALVIWRAMEWKYRATFDGLDHRLKLKDDTITHLERTRERASPTPSAVPRPTLRPPPAPPPRGERVFVEESVTLEYLSGLYRERTHIQGDKLGAAYIGKWIRVTGKVAFATPLWEDGASVSLELEPDRDGFRSAYLVFLAGRERLEALRPKDVITVVGRIQRFDKSEMELQECELLAIR